MNSTKKYSRLRKITHIIIGALLIISPVINDSFSGTEWEGPTKIGNNLGTLLLPVLGIYLIYLVFKHK